MISAQQLGQAIARSQRTDPLDSFVMDLLYRYPDSLRHIAGHLAAYGIQELEPLSGERPSIVLAAKTVTTLNRQRKDRRFQIISSNEYIVRIGEGDYEPFQPISSVLLQPTYSGGDERYWWAILKKAETTGIGVDDLRQVCRRLVVEGLELVNPSTYWIGKIDGVPFVINPWVIKKIDVGQGPSPEFCALLPNPQPPLKERIASFLKVLLC